MNSFYPTANATSRVRRTGMVSLLFALAMSTFGTQSAEAAAPASAFGAEYQPPSSVVPEQSLVVFYRPSEVTGDPAHVYLDGSFQNALLPGGFTQFCVEPGQHSLEVYVGDAPLYAGKRAPKVRARLEGGKSYFLRVPTDVKASTPVAVPRSDAEKELQGLREQVHVLDRTSSTVACKTMEETRFSLRGDVLFRFAKSGYEDITAAGHDELRKVAEAIKDEPFSIQRIDVSGYADPIGHPDANMRLSQERAQTVRRVLLDLGVRGEIVHAIGRGATDLVETKCSARETRAGKIACNAPNRRVDILVTGVRVAK